MERDLVLVHLDKNASTEEVLVYLREHSLTPATSDDLLAFGAANPELQRQFPIVAVGSVSVVDGIRCALYLRRDGSERGLLVALLGDDWAGFCRFLVRK